MKKNQNVCPGCSRHCTADCVRCKRGRTYFAKKETLEASQPPLHMEPLKKKHHHKWERNLTEDGAIRRMLRMSKEIKKALRHGEISEDRLLEILDEREQHQFSETIEKMNYHFRKCMHGVSNLYL